MNSEQDHSARSDALAKMLTAARIHRRRGDLAAAWRSLDDALAIGADDAELWELMGLLNLDEDDLDAADTSLRKALALNPELKDAEVGLGTVTLELARRAQAAEAQLLAFESGAAGRAPKQQTDWIAQFALVLPGLRQMRSLAFGRGLLFLLGGPCWLYLASYGVHVENRSLHFGFELFLGLLAFAIWSGCAAVDAQRVEQAERDEALRRL